MLELQIAWLWTVSRFHEARAHAERGDIVQTVVIIAALVAGALVVTAILVGKARDAAQSVKTQ